MIFEAEKVDKENLQEFTEKNNARNCVNAKNKVE